MVTLTQKWVDCFTKTVESTAKQRPPTQLPSQILVFLQILQHPSSFWMHQGSKIDGRRAYGG
jgi:hypothetical protein